MNTRRINGFLFEKLLYNGLANLRRSEQKLNSLNVFPVADGDTGTNMRLTLEHGLRHAKRSEQLCLYLRSLNEGLLLGARGNSGVILSQIFRGMYLHLARCAAANCGDMRNAFIQGYKTAYQAVIQPVEGTILTVAREGIENIRRQIDRNTTMEALFSMYVAEMRKSLSHTPEMLPALKAAGVIDSGALGYITIVEGMSKFLGGEILKMDIPAAPPVSSEPAPAAPADLSAFDEHSVFEKGYCMEFVLQLMADPAYSQGFALDTFIKEIQPFGDSLAVTRDKNRVKVHIHTKKPAFILTHAQRYGEFLTFKLDNMQLQHNEQLRKQKKVAAAPAKPFGMIAVTAGTGMAEAFTRLGCDKVLDGGATMNTPSGDFLAAYAAVNAEHLVVLTNSKNVVGAAEQAREMSGRENIHILPTKTPAEGYFAASMDIGNSQDPLARLESIRKGADGVVTLSVARAERAYTDEGGVSCAVGDYIALSHDHVVAAAPDPVSAFLGGLAALPDAADRETCLVFSGEEADPTAKEALEARLGEEFPLLECRFIHGGQPTYLWIGGLI